MVDNCLFNKTSRLDAKQVLWRRVLDVNDRSLRDIRTGRGDDERRTGFDITAASEVMAALCLSESYHDLRARLQRMLVGASIY